LPNAVIATDQPVDARADELHGLTPEKSDRISGKTTLPTESREGCRGPPFFSLAALSRVKADRPFSDSPPAGPARGLARGSPASLDPIGDQLAAACAPPAALRSGSGLGSRLARASW